MHASLFWLTGRPGCESSFADERVKMGTQCERLFVGARTDAAYATQKPVYRKELQNTFITKKPLCKI